MEPTKRRRLDRLLVGRRSGGAGVAAAGAALGDSERIADTQVHVVVESDGGGGGGSW